MINYQFRITFAAARDSNLPKILSMIDIDHMTPTPSILITVLYLI